MPYQGKGKERNGKERKSDLSPKFLIMNCIFFSHFSSADSISNRSLLHREFRVPYTDNAANF